ncbi:MAG: geranylgeranylglyceryl/heptaprenylglyceryl phosphate synthase [Bacteroidetes bacterium]|nr:geranylgeranylglyceryl/heptaprenylglyceryl phosphate synthase [Bacteroidota bacterium]
MRHELRTLLNARKAAGKKSLAVLIDPDKTRLLPELLTHAAQAEVDFFLIGGSLLHTSAVDECIAAVKAVSNVPVILFPGNALQLSANADALLLLSVISGRNAELLIGKHVAAAPQIKSSGLEVLSTGYMLVETGRPTTVHYMSQTIPLPAHKPEIAACTAMAGEQLGLSLLYLEAGSGADAPVPADVIKAVSSSTTIPLLTGGGIRTPEQAAQSCAAGADVIVVGNILEDSPHLLKSISLSVHAPCT